jgi:hypothetical protein
MRKFDKEWECRCSVSPVEIEHLNNMLSINAVRSFDLDHLYRLFVKFRIQPEHPVIVRRQER